MAPMAAIGASTVTSPARSKISVKGRVPPSSSGAARSISMMCSPPGASATAPPGGISKGPAGRIFMVPPSCAMAWIAIMPAVRRAHADQPVGRSPRCCGS